MSVFLCCCCDYATDFDDNDKPIIEPEVENNILVNVADNDDTQKSTMRLTEFYDNIYRLNQKLSITNTYIPLFTSKQMFDAPKIVLIGTQSSGKTSFVNNLIGFDIFPTGKGMMTRTPLSITLKKSLLNEIYIYRMSADGRIPVLRSSFNRVNQNIILSKSRAMKCVYRTFQYTSKYLVQPCLISRLSTCQAWFPHICKDNRKLCHKTS